MKLPVASLALVLALAAPGAVLAQESFDDRLDFLFGDHESFNEAYDALTTAVDMGDAETVASLVQYPLEITLSGKKTVIDDEDEFVARYDDIFSPQIVETLMTQDRTALFANDEGVMWGNGEVWMSPICLESSCMAFYWLISAINEPE